MRSIIIATYIAAFTSLGRAIFKASRAALLLFPAALLLAGGAATVCGQSALDGFDPNASGTIRVVVVQPDGKILLGGSFSTQTPTPTSIPGTPTSTSNILLVTTTADGGTGSLRQALANATDGDTIQFDGALNGQAITLTSGELVIDKNITISGPGPSVLAVSAAAGFRIFHVMPSHTVIIEGLKIRFGSPGESGGGVRNDQATLTINNCAVESNHRWSLGGGIYNNGSGATTTFVNSTVSQNFVDSGLNARGGGIYNDGGMVEIVNSTVSSNRADRGHILPPAIAGGIMNLGTMTITNSTVSSNFAQGGGGGI